MECVGCGTEYEGHSKLCPSCRKKYTEQIKRQHDYWTCPICGGSIQFSYWKRREDIKAKTICCSTRCRRIYKALMEVSHGTWNDSQKPGQRTTGIRAR